MRYILHLQPGKFTYANTMPLLLVLTWLVSHWDTSYGWARENGRVERWT